MVPETVMMMKIFPAPSSRVNHSWWDLSLARPDTSTQHLPQYTHYTVYNTHGTAGGTSHSSQLTAPDTV